MIHYNPVFIRNVYPGDFIHEEGRKCLGIFNNRAIVIGNLCKIEDLLFIRSKTNFYVPRKNDIVMGKVKLVTRDFYKVEINAYTGILPILSFFNATKKNKPELLKNDIVISQVQKIERDQILLSNKNLKINKINEVFEIEPYKVRMLYFSNYLKRLPYNYKIALGMNGYVYIEGDNKDKREIYKSIN